MPLEEPEKPTPKTARSDCQENHARSKLKQSQVQHRGLLTATDNNDVTLMLHIKQSNHCSIDIAPTCRRRMEPGAALGGSPNVSGPAITMPPAVLPVFTSFERPPALGSIACRLHVDSTCEECVCTAPKRWLDVTCPAKPVAEQQAAALPRAKEVPASCKIFSAVHVSQQHNSEALPCRASLARFLQNFKHT